MILHRLRLNNFRGVTDREIAFPDHGVVVVCGPNEIGKSSMLEALDVLLGYRDRSTHRDVKAVKPANADVGAEVEAEIATGRYRFVYRKRFHKKTMTELEIIEPKREQLSGDGAHERVQAMLAETLDTKLWEAQRVLQSASTESVNLSGCDALSRALDAAAGEADAGSTASGDESLLIDRVDAEFLKYFTATGRPTGVWKAVNDRVKAAESEAARCRLAVEAVNDRVARHQTLTVALRGLEESLLPATARLTAARAAGAALAELREHLNQARLVATAVAATAANSGLADAQRRQLIADAERRGQALAGLRAALTGCEGLEATAAGAAAAAAVAAGQAESACEAAQRRLETARASAQACLARDSADKLAPRVAAIGQVEADLGRIAADLAAITLTADALAGIERQSAAVQRIEAQLRSDAGSVEFTAAAGLEVVVDGRSQVLTAGQVWAQPTSAALRVEVPGVLSVRIEPGASAATLRADLEAAARLLAEELAATGVSDVEAARALDARRRALVEACATQRAKLEGLCAGQDVASLRAELTELRAAAADAEQIDPETAMAELRAAEDALRTARAEAELAQKAAVAATTEAARAATGTTVARERLRTADAESVAVLDQLATVRAAVTDEAVAAQAAADAAEQRTADAAVAVLAERYAAADPAAVDAELSAAAATVETITGERDAARLELHTLAAELGVISAEGRQGQLDEANAELERARAEHLRLAERAAAAQLLRSTMIRHRDNTRRRYVQPYRTELERLGRQVFGDTFEVDVDTDLTIQTRTLDGCTVPFDSLSGGAKEQLGILARLAGAALVAEHDTVPVIIDDALGFSDPDRLDRMTRLFGTVGDSGQVIVLTCQHERYAGIAGATVIKLSA